MVANSYRLFRSLMAAGKKEFFSLEVLHFTLLYLRPEGRSVNSPWWGWEGSLRMEATLLVTLRWYMLSREANGVLVILCSLRHSLQAFTVHDSRLMLPYHTVMQLVRTLSITQL